jgi:hypothetical protein
LADLGEIRPFKAKFGYSRQNLIIFMRKVRPFFGQNSTVRISTEIGGIGISVHKFSTAAATARDRQSEEKHGKIRGDSLNFMLADRTDCLHIFRSSNS